MSSQASQTTEAAPDPISSDLIGSGQEGTVGDQFRAYLQRLRSGDMGALPAVGGFVVLTVLFSFLSPFFLTERNFANLLTQAATEPVIAAGTITMGSNVRASDLDGKVHQFVLVSPLEAGANRGHISTASPVGIALLGRRVGDRVEIETPSGRRTLTVLTVA